MPRLSTFLPFVIVIVIVIVIAIAILFLFLFALLQPTRFTSPHLGILASWHPGILASPHLHISSASRSFRWGKKRGKGKESRAAVEQACRYTDHGRVLGLFHPVAQHLVRARRQPRR
jgi:hypothetical protein